MKEDKELKQFRPEEKPKTLDDYIKIENGRLVLKTILQTENFIEQKRGVRIRGEGLDSSGGTIQGATIGSDTTVISGTLEHTGPAVGFYGQTPTSQQSDIVALTISAGSADNTVADVGAAFSQSTLNNNFADLATKINQIRTVLRNLGLTT